MSKLTDICKFLQTSLRGVEIKKRICYYLDTISKIT